MRGPEPAMTPACQCRGSWGTCTGPCRGIQGRGCSPLHYSTASRQWSWHLCHGTNCILDRHCRGSSRICVPQRWSSRRRYRAGPGALRDFCICRSAAPAPGSGYGRIHPHCFPGCRPSLPGCRRRAGGGWQARFLWGAPPLLEGAANSLEALDKVPQGGWPHAETFRLPSR